MREREKKKMRQRGLECGKEVGKVVKQERVRKCSLHEGFMLTKEERARRRRRKGRER